MPLLAILTIICQVCCGAHAIKTGQERYWLYIIIMLPAIGCAIYVLAILLPDMLSSYKGQQVITEVKSKVAPTRNLKQLRNELAISDSLTTRVALADELAKVKQYEEAISHYKFALEGVHESDPEVLLKLAIAEFNISQYQACQNTLDYLIEKNPEFRSPEGHLLYARTTENLGNTSKAEEEYKVLVSYYSGPDAGFYYANFLQQQNRLHDAREQLRNIQIYAKIAPKFYRKLHKVCLAQTNQLLDELTKRVNTH